MGLLPLAFKDGASWRSLGVTGEETVSIHYVLRKSRRRRLTSQNPKAAPKGSFLQARIVYDVRLVCASRTKAAKRKGT